MGEVKVIGLSEKIMINGKAVLAKIDTGAERNSLDVRLAAELGLGPIIGVRRYVNVHGKTIRPLVKAHLEINGKKIHASFNLFDRQNLKFRVLIGKKTLKKAGFLIDPRK
ncbi:MAG TPA: RimK/LysX family protein [Candidatus Nanoarchaeia archaeon]|nr:RimK/LysX family protein [Candidatus Nanoarchaeia archaeon]